MNRDFLPTWKLNINADNNEMCTLLHKHLPVAYEEWLESRSALFGDDEDAPLAGSFEVVDFMQLLNLLVVLANAKTITDWSLWAICGDRKTGCTICLSTKHQRNRAATWFGDETQLAQDFSQTFHTMKRLLSELEYPQVDTKDVTTNGS